MSHYFPASAQAKCNLVGQIYCTFSMGESLTLCNNVTISNNRLIIFNSC